MSKFTHLHVHTHYSILDGAAKVKDLIKKAKDLGMDSIAITDHGNMFGVMEFVNEANNAGIKPIIGVETYIARRGVENKSTREDRSGYHLVLLAKNEIGYNNLINLVSRSYTEGFYYSPRMDKSWLKEHSEGLIASSACLGGEIPRMILNYSMDKAEESLLSYLEIFKDDFYLELMSHGHEDQKIVNKALFELGQKHNVKLIATNDIHFIEKDDYEAHKLLIRINTGKDDMEDSMFYTGNEYLKSYDEMLELFPNNPEVLENTINIANSIEPINLNKKAIMPLFPIPDEFENDDDYLRHLAFEGARKKYGEIDETISSRINYELGIIKNMGFAGYFLIIQDLIAFAKKRNILVGPGRGSAAGSVVAYATDITNIDPIKYKLLFERFLNPERISMPDIDTDFDDEGREFVFQYVVDKYGQEKVAQIITFGTLASRSAIRDVARVMGVELSIADKLAKLISDNQTIQEAIDNNQDFKNITLNGTEIEKKVIENAIKLEGTIRQTGVHACGTIIGRYPLQDTIPLSMPKNAVMPVSQYEGKIVEKAGLLKMDILGLKTLSVIKNTVDYIKKRHNIEIDVDQIPLDDTQTLELFQRGETVGIFQFESAGMRKWLKELKPTSIEDLIAMNALYRPGPLQHIPEFINCKHGKTQPQYLHHLLKPILEDTYGIMVYQEQIMEAAKTLAGYSLSKADILRRAMGKKIVEEMRGQKSEFIKGVYETNQIDEKSAIAIFDQIEEFAKYGFNKSHAVAYAVLATQTAWLKTHYPEEFIASLLSSNLSDLTKITTFIDEAKSMNIHVLGPDINESEHDFTVVKDNTIRFGLSAIKNMGKMAAQSIIEERELNGKYLSIEDFLQRLDTKSVNKRSIEALAYSGGFDSFNIHRAQFFHKKDDSAFIDDMIKHASYLKNIASQNQLSLFGDASEVSMPSLEFPICEPFSKFEQLKYEKEMIGFYINSHPISQYKFELEHFRKVEIKALDDLDSLMNKQITFAGMITESQEKLTKNNNKYGVFTIEDETMSFRINIFKDTYLKFKHLLEVETFVMCTALVQTNFYSKRTDLKIESIELLSGVSDKISEAELIIPLYALADFAETIVSSIKTFKGNINIKFSIYDKEKIGNRPLSLINTNIKVNKDFLKYVNQFENCTLKVKSI